MEKKIVKEGKGHFLGRHKFEIVPYTKDQWDESLYGEYFTKWDAYYATYRDLYRCRCGAEMVTSEIALI